MNAKDKNAVAIEGALDDYYVAKKFEGYEGKPYEGLAPNANDENVALRYSGLKEIIQNRFEFTKTDIINNWISLLRAKHCIAGNECKPIGDSVYILRPAMIKDTKKTIVQNLHGRAKKKQKSAMVCQPISQN